jgi:hypothetical protein
MNDSVAVAAALLARPQVVGAGTKPRDTSLGHPVVGGSGDANRRPLPPPAVDFYR